MLNEDDDDVNPGAPEGTEAKEKKEEDKLKKVSRAPGDDDQNLSCEDALHNEEVTKELYSLANIVDTKLRPKLLQEMHQLLDREERLKRRLKKNNLLGMRSFSRMLENTSGNAGRQS